MFPEVFEMLTCWPLSASTWQEWFWGRGAYWVTSQRTKWPPPGCYLSSMALNSFWSAYKPFTGQGQAWTEIQLKPDRRLFTVHMQLLFRLSPLILWAWCICYCCSHLKTESLLYSALKSTSERILLSVSIKEVPVITLQMSIYCMKVDEKDLNMYKLAEYINGQSTCYICC